MKEKLDKKSRLSFNNVKIFEQFQIVVIESHNENNSFTDIYFQENRFTQTPKSLKEWEKILPSNLFVRINRWTIINLSFVKHIMKIKSNKYVVIMSHVEKEYNMSKSFIHNLNKQLDY